MPVQCWRKFSLNVCTNVCWMWWVRTCSDRWRGECWWEANPMLTLRLFPIVWAETCTLVACWRSDRRTGAPLQPHRLISPPQRAGKLSKCCGHRVHWSPSWSARKWSVATICRTIPYKRAYYNCSRTWHRWHPRFVMKVELHCVVYVLCFRFFFPQWCSWNLSFLTVSKWNT